MTRTKQQKPLRRRLMRIAIIIILIADIALLLLTGLVSYNKYARYEFEPVFIGFRAWRVFERGAEVSITFNKEQYIRDHLFEPPRWLKSLIK